MKKLFILSLLAILALGVQAQNIELPKEHKMMSDMPLKKALQLRQTTRQMSEIDIPPHILSDLLWAAYGYNRPDEHKRTAPSARNMQEMDIYLFSREGIYLYEADRSMLRLILKGDHRKSISSQEHFAVAPVSIVIVANYDRMTGMDEEARNFYAPCDAGYVSQNIYLYCAASHMATVACGAINRDELAKLLHIKNGKAMLAHPVSFMDK